MYFILYIYHPSQELPIARITRQYLHSLNASENALDFGDKSAGGGAARVGVKK